MGFALLFMVFVGVEPGFAGFAPGFACFAPGFASDFAGFHKVCLLVLVLLLKPIKTYQEPIKTC